MRGRAGGLIAGLAALAPAAALAFPDGAPAGHTGGFGEPTCAECHFGGEPPEPGALRLAGLADGFEPGASYDLDLRLHLAGMVVGGFQLAVRFAEDPGRGGSAGRLHGGEGTTITTQGAVDYLGHSAVARADGAAEAVGWRLRWSAPQAARPVVFHVTAVAGNDDLSPIGGVVHRLELRVPPR